MKSSLVFCCLLLAVSAVRHKEKKTTLEDVEKDYATTEQRTKLTPPPPPKPAAQSPTQFGFVPVKTFTDYIQQEPKVNYFPRTYVSQHNKKHSQPQYTQLFNPQADYSQYSSAQQQQQQQQQQYIIPQAYSAAPAQYANSKYTVANFNKQPEASYAQPQNYYQQYENVQYITDNSIAGQAGQAGQSEQQYYTPQYVYLQQYQAPSTSVQTIVDPKGGLQYVMYVPSYPQSTEDEEHSQSYENVAYTTAEAANYQVPETKVPQKEQSYVQPENKGVLTEYIIKREPKSLLDSYIPSSVQLQYYKQAQQNSIQEPIKIPRTFGSKSHYRPTPAESSIRYTYRPSYKS